ncbi:MAG: hypothetical protein QOE59_3308 [Actinomycetota bacterium]|nr:hypothetical protein [Actinomycetota bacterium]
MATPDDEPSRERRFPDTERLQRDFPDTGAPATTPGLVVTEERLADGRHITYFGIAR